MMVEHQGEIELTWPGLLQVDRLLPTFFEPEFRGGRYTEKTILELTP